MNAIYCYKKTKENWYPNYKDNLVSIYFDDFSNQPHYKDENKYLISITGNDDFGLERWFGKYDGELAQETLLTILRQPYVEQKFIRSLGFVSM